MKDRIYQLTTWSCGCREESKVLSITDERCPRCGAAMPQSVRSAIYKKIRGELDKEIRRERMLRLKKLKAVAGWALTLLLVVLAVVGVQAFFQHNPEVAAGALGWLWDAGEAIVNGCAAMIDWFLGLLGNVGDFFAGVGDFFGGIFRFIGAVFSGLWMLGCWLWDVLWDFLGFLWEILPTLVRGLMWLLEFVWDIVVLLFLLIWELICLIPKIIGFIWDILFN
jgi:hypothetical protein